MNLLTPFMAEFPKSYFYCIYKKGKGFVEISSEEFWEGRRSGNLETKTAALVTAVHNAIYQGDTHGHDRRY